MSKSQFTNVLPKGTPKAKFKRHHVHEVATTVTDAKQVSKDYSNRHRYPHRMTLTVNASPNLRPYDPVYLDGLPNNLSGYWTVLGVRHIFNGPLGNYIMELHVGTDVLGDTNPLAGTASQQRDINSSLVNQNTTNNASALIDVSFATPIDGTPVANLAVSTSNVVAPMGLMALGGIPTLTVGLEKTPDFSSIKRTITWNSVSTAPTISPTKTASSMPSITSNVSTPTLNDMFITVRNDTSYNNCAVDVVVNAKTTGGADISVYRVTTIPATITFTSTTPTVSVTNIPWGTYTFVANAANTAGTSPNITSAPILVATKPQALTINTATFIDSNTASITYTDGSNGGSAITGHAVISTPTVSDIVVTDSSGTLTVTGSFKSGTSYIFSVSATNQYGSSPATTSSSIICPAATQPFDAIFLLMGAN